jgi:hypothetical protein
MTKTIQAKVASIEYGAPECVVLECLNGETIPPKATVMTKAIFHEQQPVIAAPDRVKILGKGKLGVSLGELVEIRVISGSGS